MRETAEPLVSVIVPVYNAEKYLKNCIDSIICQTHKNLDIIFVDDGSTDGSAGICDLYAARDKRINVLHTPNGGVSAARNIGMKFMRGEYLVFIDSDDTVERCYVEKLIELISRDGVDLAVIYSYCDEADAGGYNSKNDGIYYFSPRQAIQAIYTGHYFLGYVWGKIYKTNLLHDLTFDTAIANCEDELFLAEYLFRCKAVCFRPDKLYNYVVYPESASRGCVTDKKLTMFESKEKVKKLAKKYYGEELTVYIDKNIILSVQGLSGKIQYSRKEDRKRYTKVLKKVFANTYSLKTRRMLSVNQKIKADIMKINFGLFLFIIKIKTKLFQIKNNNE